MELRGINLYELLIMVDRFGLVLKNTRFDYTETYGEWDIPNGFVVTLADEHSRIIIEGIYETTISLTGYCKRFIDGLSCKKKLETIHVLSDSAPERTIAYSDFLKTIA